MKTKKKNIPSCIDPKIGDRLGLDIVVVGAQGKRFELSSERNAHLQECEFCQQHLALWTKKAEATYQDLQYGRTLRLVPDDDRRIVRRQLKDGLGLFKPFESSEREGLVVVVDPHNEDLLRIIRGKMKLDEFLASK